MMRQKGVGEVGYIASLGLRLIESDYMVDQRQNRKHRKKRINKKWAKRYGFTVTPKQEIFKMGNTIICHPNVAQKIRDEL